MGLAGDLDGMSSSDSEKLDMLADAVRDLAG